MKGGAVRLERSPLKEAMDWWGEGGVSGEQEREKGEGRREKGKGKKAYLEERGPAAARSLGVGLRRVVHGDRVDRQTAKRQVEIEQVGAKGPAKAKSAVGRAVARLGFRRCVFVGLAMRLAWDGLGLPRNWQAGRRGVVAGGREWRVRSRRRRRRRRGMEGRHTMPRQHNRHEDKTSRRYNDESARDNLKSSCGRIGLLVPAVASARN